MKDRKRKEKQVRT